MSDIEITPNQQQFLDKNRIVNMIGSFNEKTAESVMNRLLHLETLSPTQDILLFIDSYGGAIDSFISLHDIIKLLRCDVVTVCVGKAMSAGFMLLISGKKGKRFITPNSRAFYHEIWGGSIGTASKLDIHVKEIKRLQHVIESMTIKYTKITKTTLPKIFNRDTYFTATQCLKLGIVDHIITSSRILYKNINI